MPEFPKPPIAPVIDPSLDNVAAGLDQLQSDPVLPSFPEMEPYPQLYHPPISRGNVPADPANVPAGETMEQMWARIARTNRPGGPQKTGFDIYPAGEVTSERYPHMLPGIDNEDAFGQAQGFWTKALHGVTKGVVSVGTTFTNSTVGLVAGAMSFAETGEFSSMWDNDVTRLMDEATTNIENTLPNYYTAAETNADWYTPTNLLSGNMLWDKFVKTLGFVVGAGLAGGGYSQALRALGLGSELAATGRLAQAVEAAESAAIAGEGAGGMVTRLSSLGGGRATMGKYLDETNRVLTSGLSVTGEAQMEALGASNDYRRNAIQKYRDEHNGEVPTGEAIKQINRNADAVGSTTMAMNMALLTATQYVQLPKILGSAWPAARSVENSMFKYLERDATGKWLVSEQAKGILPRLGRLGESLFSYSEAFEELSQYAIEKGSQNYWNKHNRGVEGSFLGDLLSNYKDVGSDILMSGYTQALSDKEGMESMLLGGIAGGLTQRIMGGNEKKQQRDQATAFATAANDAQSIPQLLSVQKMVDVGRSLDRGTVIDESLQRNVTAGNEKEARDDIYDNVHNTLAVRIKYGAYDQVVDEIKAYQKMAASDEGFNQLVKEGKANSTDTKESFRARTEYLLAEAKSIYDLQRGLTLKYSGIRDGEGKPLFTPSVIEKMVYSASKLKNIDERATAISGELADIGLDPTPHITEAFKQGKESIIEDYLTKATSTLTPEQQSEARLMTADLAKLMVDRKLFTEDYKRHMNNPVVSQEELTPEKLAAQLDKALKAAEAAQTGQPVAEEEEDELATPQEPEIKGRLGKMKVGQSYYLTNVVHSKEKDAVGRILPPFRVIKKNADGTLTVQNTLTNETMDIGEGDVAPYTLHSVEGAKKTKTGAWFLEHIMDIYEMKLGKGETVQGRLSYRPQNNTLYFSYSKGGKIIHKQISNYDLVAQKGYREPKITRVGTIAPRTVEEAARDAQATADMAAEQDAFAAQKVEQRRAIMGQLVSDTVDSITRVEEELSDVKKRLDAINEQIQDPDVFLDPEKVGALIKDKEFLEEMVTVLEQQKDELEYELGYFKDVIDHMDELPTDTREFSRNLRDTLNKIQAANDKLAPSIEKVKKLIAELDDTIEAAVALLKEAFDKFTSRNPNLFTLEETELGYVLATMPDALTNPDAYKADLKELQDVLDEVNTSFLKPSNKKKKGLSRELERLSKEIAPIQKELKAAQAIYDQFSKVYKQYQQKEADAAALKADAELQATTQLNQAKAAVNSGSPVLEPEMMAEEEKAYEKKTVAQTVREAAKKIINILFGATTSPTIIGNSAEAQRTIAFQKDHDAFTAIVDQLPIERRNNLVRVFVSSKNQTAAGLPGLIPETHSFSAASVAKDPTKKGQELIYAVYGEVFERKFYYLDSKGERIEDPVANMDSVVRGIMPTSSLVWTGDWGSEERYSRATAEEAAKYAEQHEKERNVILNSEQMQTPHEFQVSRGIMVKDTSGQKHNIVGSLLSEVDMSKNVLRVVLKDTPFEHNGIKYPGIAPGSVMVANGATMEYANNRRFTDREKALLKKVFAHYATLSNRGIVQSDGSIKRGLHPTITEFLQGLLYFQHPVSKVNGVETTQQVLSKSQFYIDNGELFFGRSDTDASLAAGQANFDGASLSDDTMNVAMVAFLGQAYHNVNHTFLKNPKQFNEIIDIGTNGELVLRTWPSYQHYLISPKYPDGTPRHINDTPLSTRVIPEKNAGGTANVVSRYTYNPRFGIPHDAAPIPQRATRTNPVPPTPGAPVPVVQTTMFGTTAVKYTMTGGVVTVMSTPEEIAPILEKLRPRAEQAVLDNYNEALRAQSLPETATFAEIDDDAVKNTVTDMAIILLEKAMEATLPAQAAPTVPGEKSVTFEGIEVRYTGEGDNMVLLSTPTDLLPLTTHPKLVAYVKNRYLEKVNQWARDNKVTELTSYDQLDPTEQMTEEDITSEVMDLLLPTFQKLDMEKYPQATVAPVVEPEPAVEVHATTQQAPAAPQQSPSVVPPATKAAVDLQLNDEIEVSISEPGVPETTTTHTITGIGKGATLMIEFHDSSGKERRYRGPTTSTSTFQPIEEYSEGKWIPIAGGGVTIRTTQPATSASVPTMFTNKMVADLRALGMTPAQINKLTPAEAHAIITSGVAPKVSTVEATKTRAIEDAEIIDSLNAQDGTQQVELATLIKNGTITFTEDDNSPC